MPKNKQSGKSPSVDIFQLLSETAERDKRKRREELLAPLGLTEYFVLGNITLDKRTCRGIDCKLCIKACPTNALFWKGGTVEIVPELCIYCGACVLSCIVDDCIDIERKRADGKVERFSKPKAFTALQHSINARKRFERVGARARDFLQDLLPKPEETVQRPKSKKRRTTKKGLGRSVLRRSRSFLPFVLEKLWDLRRVSWSDQHLPAAELFYLAA